MLKKISILSGTILTTSLILFLSYTGKYDCLFKKYFHFSCPACGITRSFMALLKLDIIQSLKYNILTIPLLVFAIFVTYLIIYDIIKKQNCWFTKMTDFLKKQQIFIYVLVLLATLINNILKT